MRKKQLIEKLADLATFLALSQNDANKNCEKEKEKEKPNFANYWAGRESAFNVAFLKVDSIIKEVKE